MPSYERIKPDVQALRPKALCKRNSDLVFEARDHGLPGSPVLGVGNSPMQAWCAAMRQIQKEM